MLKRLFDILFSLSVLIFFSPLFLLIAILIKATSPGPVFYRQKRVGLSGKTIYCTKFRTMQIDADAILTKLLQESEEHRKEFNLFFKLKNDPRITSIGKFLRKTSLDELPQFYDVLIGNLSVVGPRPVTEYEIREFYRDHAPLILSIRPGITGVWQTSGRNEVQMDERVQMDVSYVHRRNFFHDLYLILKTIPAMIFSKGAY